MTTRHNLLKRGNRYHYRGSFTLNGKVISIRLALNTSSLLIARERAARIDRKLKGKWRLMENETTDGLSDHDKASILRASAIGMRDSLEQLHLRDQVDGYDDEQEVRTDQVLTLRALKLVVRDLHIHGVGPGFGTFEHFSRRFLDDGPGNLEGDQLVRIQEILDAPGLRDSIVDGPVRSLVSRNIPVTDVNVALARRQVLLGVLTALREAEQEAMNPAARLDQLLDGLAMPAISPADPPVTTILSATPIDPQVATVPTPSPIVGAARGAVGVAALSIADAAKAFLDANPKLDVGEAASRWTAKTRSQFDAIIFLAGKFFGTALLASITEDEIAAFFRALRRLPRNHHKTPSHAGMTLQEIGAANHGEGLSLATTNRHMRFLRMVFDWAAKRMPDPPVIGWGQFVETDGRVKRDKRLAFTADELTTLLTGAVWTGSESQVRRLKPGRQIWRDAAYWVPLMLIYTGCRREEVAKAQVTDIEQVAGIWVLRVRDTDTGRVKTPSSVRDVPLADELIRLGLLGFVDLKREAGQSLLFPELAGGSSYGDVFYKKWWRGFMRAGLVPSDKDVHSIRHFVATALAQAGVSEEQRADLLGHVITSSETGRTYTKRTPLPILKDVVDRIPQVSAHLGPRL